MYGVCIRYFPNTVIAQDILQDGFIKVFENISSFRFEGSIEGWIRKIIVNTALEYLRKAKEENAVDLSDASLIIDEPSGSDSDYMLLLSLISNLPTQYRTVFNLYAIEGYSHSEISKVLEISESTSKSNYCRAKAILREKVTKIEEFEHYAIL
jgi:RNA polymerase sigma-70 factor (ECF subfamily)